MIEAKLLPSKGGEVAVWANAAASKAVLPLILRRGSNPSLSAGWWRVQALVRMGDPFSEILVSATLAKTLVAVVSTVQARLAGVASELPAASVDLTSKVWEPLLSPS